MLVGGGHSENGIVDLTGGVHIANVYLRPFLANDEFWARLEYYHSCGCYFMACSKRGSQMEGNTSVGIITNHAYSLLAAITTRAGERLVHIRNPWYVCNV